MSYILVVDDDEDFASAVSKALRDARHEVAIALDTQTATESIDKRTPDLVVLDVMFPEDSTAGFTLARAIYQKHGQGPSGKPIPVLMLTAVNTRFPLGFASKDIDEDWLPVHDFVEKPVDLDNLVQRAGDLLARIQAKA